MQTSAADQLHRAGGSLVAPSRRPHSATERNHEQREDHSRAARQPASGRQEPHKQPPPWALAQTLHGSRRQRGGGNTPVSTASTTWTTACLCSGSLLLGPATGSLRVNGPASKCSVDCHTIRSSGAAAVYRAHCTRCVCATVEATHPRRSWKQLLRRVSASTLATSFKNAIPKQLRGLYYL